MKAKPFIKWVGGKTQLLWEINSRMPSSFNNYYEPFLGGGAVLFFILNNFTTREIIVNDLSDELICAYNSIKENPKKLMQLLDEHEKNHILSPKEYFYKIRNLDQLENWTLKDIFTRSARLIYLNRACFNGMYRVNSNGYFNVPWNQKESIKLYDYENIIKLNILFNNTNLKLYNEDFEKACETAKKGDFVFFDPPYDLLNDSTFDGYNKNKFGKDGQIRLAKLAHDLRDKGCYVMLTNHNTKLVNELYQDFKIDVVKVKRLINSNAKLRTGEETIIYSY